MTEDQAIAARAPHPAKKRKLTRPKTGVSRTRAWLRLVPMPNASPRRWAAVGDRLAVPVHGAKTGAGCGETTDVLCAWAGGPAARPMCPAATLIAASAATAPARPAIFAARGQESVPRLPRSSAISPHGRASSARQADVISADMNPPFIPARTGSLVIA